MAQTNHGVGKTSQEETPLQEPVKKAGVYDPRAGSQNAIDEMAVQALRQKLAAGNVLYVRQGRRG